MDSIIQTILKLLAKADADKNDNDHERDQCLTMANDLMEKHNLSMAQIQGTNLEDPSSINVEEKQSDFDSDPWKRYVIRAVVTLFNCKVWYKTYGNKYKAVFIGTADNIAVVTGMIQYYMNSIEREAKARWKSGKGSAFLRKSFCLAAAEELNNRVKQLIEAEKPKTTGTALVLVKNALQKANDDFMKKHHPNMGKMRSRSSSVDRGAYNQGKEYGASLNISKNKQLTG